MTDSRKARHHARAAHAAARVAAERKRAELAQRGDTGDVTPTHRNACCAEFPECGCPIEPPGARLVIEERELAESDFAERDEWQRLEGVQSAARTEDALRYHAEVERLRAAALGLREAVFAGGYTPLSEGLPIERALAEFDRAIGGERPGG